MGLGRVIDRLESIRLEMLLALADRMDLSNGGTEPLVPSQPSTDGSNRATPPDSTPQCRLGPPLEATKAGAQNSLEERQESTVKPSNWSVSTVSRSSSSVTVHQAIRSISSGRNDETSASHSQEAMV
ncbi:hypothetical protein SAMN05443661_11565 [Natronobacterium gregoryi]|uniref:Uncharacterized protein n=1 Tax=Natronobacterium gregoryi TaxID=44930 RepID=A0A1I3NYS6_9EURY|nr:hypothetical protein SAMN05443661_11565 [Natronobacterium gregoryi]